MKYAAYIGGEKNDEGVGIAVDDEENDIRVSFIRMNANLADKKKPADAIEVQRIPH